MTALDLELWAEEAAVFAPRRSLTVAEFAEQHRVLEAANHARPGPWRNDVTPYMVGVMDAISDRRCREVVLMCCAQAGKTESALINPILWSVDQHPRPTLVVFPSETDVKQFLSVRLKSAIANCDVMRAHRLPGRGEWKTGELGFDTMRLYTGWAGSAAKLASKSIGAAYLDEVDKYPSLPDEAHPVWLARERLQWWRTDSMFVVSSTPTTEAGMVAQLFAGTDKRAFWVPCPLCGRFQPLTFSRETVIIPDGQRDPDRIATDRLASYRCTHCKQDIADDDGTRRRMMLRGVWCPDGDQVDVDGAVTGPVPLDGPSRGFHLNRLYSPTSTWSDMAAEFLRSKDTPERMVNFRNSWEGLPWVDRIHEMSPRALARRQDPDLPRGWCPHGTVGVTIGVDVQQDRLVWSVLAWRPGQRAWSVDYGECVAATTSAQWEVFVTDVLNRQWPIKGGGQAPLLRVGIDAGYRTDEVYAVCADHPQVLVPVKGAPGQVAAHLRSSRVERTVYGKPAGILLWHVGVLYFKNKLAGMMSSDLGGNGCWRVHNGPAEEFLRQLCSERKIRVRKTGLEEWQQVGTTANHFWDATVYALAAAEQIGVHRLQDEAQQAAAAAHRSSPTTRPVAPPKARPRPRGGRGAGWGYRRG